MRFGSRLSYRELEDFIFSLKEKVEGHFLKNIYHFEGKWLFKFNKVSFIFDGQTIWNGSFPERENKNLHSISIKLRKEIGDRKVLSINLLEGDRIVCLEFEFYYLLLECYAKGNLLLLEKESKKIIILTRIYENYRHHQIYPSFSFRDFSTDFVPKKYSFVSGKKEVLEKEDGEFSSILEGSFFLWEQSRKKDITSKLRKKKKRSVEENIKNQEKKWELKIKKVEDDIIDLSQNIEIDYKEIGKKYKEKKIFQKKLEKTKEMKLSIPKVFEKETKLKVEKERIEEKWYHKFYWWRTKNNFLVLGGKNATDNEYLVKTYLGDNDYYFHTEDFGSGSFILLTEGKTPEEIDLYDTAEGVFSLSSSWNITKEGKVFYVLGNQVSKTPPTGMSITKGSFMIYGKKEYIPIHQTILGYGLWEEKELMLAPYRIIQRLDGPKIKILPKPNVKKMKGKVISDFLKKKLDIDIKNIPFLFSKPCILF